jgi:hypothetical protein
MNILAQPPVDLRRALELRAWVALVDRVGGHEHACAQLLRDMYATGVAHHRTCGDVQRLRIAGVSSWPVDRRMSASVLLASWHAAALDRLSGGVAP